MMTTILVVAALGSFDKVQHKDFVFFYAHQKRQSDFNGSETRTLLSSPKERARGLQAALLKSRRSRRLAV
jgi:hypothetical protein